MAESSLTSKKPRVVCVIQARMSSTRLPGKIVKELTPGRTMLEICMERVLIAKLVDKVVIATSDQPSDDSVEETFGKNGLGYTVYRGSLANLTARYHLAASSENADIVIRVTSDCPLIDPNVVDQCITKMIDTGADLCGNGVKVTYPDGLDVEAFRFSALDACYKECHDAFLTEHCSLWIKFQPGRFKIEHLINEGENLGYHRWTVDAPSDYEFVKKIFSHFIETKGLKITDFYFKDILEYVTSLPKEDQNLAPVEDETKRYDGIIKQLKVSGIDYEIVGEDLILKIEK